MGKNMRKLCTKLFFRINDRIVLPNTIRLNIIRF